MTAISPNGGVARSRWDGTAARSRWDKLWRAIAYGIAGWCIEILWTGFRSGLRGDRKLESKTYLWMFPIYALAAPLFEPLHDAVRRWPRPARAAVYAAGIMTVEYATGWALDRATGECPWDYSDETKFHLNGYVRLDYAPAWALAGLFLEELHDRLVAVVPSIRAALADKRAPEGRGSEFPRS
jgi:uncharacterized membrane protein